MSHEATPRQYCVLHFGGAPLGSGVIERSPRDLLVMTAGILWDDGNHERYGITDQIRALNPDCKIIGYASAKTVRFDWADDSPESYTGSLWNDLLPYWCYTTEGDTLQDYPAAVVVNILDPACRRAIIDNFVDSSRTRQHLDGSTGLLQHASGSGRLSQRQRDMDGTESQEIDPTNWRPTRRPARIWFTRCGRAWARISSRSSTANAPTPTLRSPP